MDSSHIRTTTIAVLLFFVAVGVALTAPAAAQQASVQNDTVTADGSTILIDTGEDDSVSVTELPDGSDVSDVSAGSYNAEENSILFTNLGGADTVSFDLAPPSGYVNGDTISFVVGGTDATLTVVGGSTPVEEEQISLSGSSITVSTGGVNSIAISELPSDVTVTNVSDSGSYNDADGSILYSDFGSGLPETVTFTLTPGDGYADGDTISFTADGTPVTLDVVETNVPDEVSNDVDSTQYNAVSGGDNELNAKDLSGSINQWASSGSVNGVDLGAKQLSALINYWADN